MFKITLEPKRLQSLISQVLALEGNASPVDANLITFNKEGAVVSAAFKSDMMVFAQYNKSFFKELEVDGDGEFMLSRDFYINRVSYGYNNSEFVTVRTDKENIYLSGDANDDKTHNKLDAISHDNNTPGIVGKMTSIGLIPELNEKLMTFDFTLLVPIDKFTSKTSYKDAVLDFNGKELNLRFSDETGGRDRPVPIKDSRGEGKAVTIPFNFEDLKRMMSQFSGEVWLSCDKKKIVMSQVNSDFALTYCLSPKIA